MTKERFKELRKICDDAAPTPHSLPALVVDAKWFNEIQAALKETLDELEHKL